ncbi:MAG: hypothetical protein H7Y18_14990 [Clostridiaceae bacterium]|nr:hypothetical protein [Clostridiaceae bacterium]
MRGYSLENEIYKVEESVRVCKLNIQNQERKLQELNDKTATMQSKITSINSLAPNKLEELTITNNRLIYYTNLKKTLILEFQATLKLYENKLHNLKSDSLCNNFEVDATE